ncbi:MAG: DegT/DnrJ/EryC1/StrS family aminotransferase [Muribaculaceae bacterium]|nr:DegT/DnrJ/EryC1/StrS family aminotransferase [Muribaculaceae bacterium]
MKRYPFCKLGEVNAPYREAIAEAMMRVLDSGRYVGGGDVSAFEDAVARLTGAKHAVGTGNGLDALRLIFRALIQTGRLKPGDGVAVPANTYIASMLAVSDNGLRIVAVDADAHTLLIDPAALEKAAGDETVKCLLTVHLYGRTAWNREIAETVKRHDLIVVEDAAQSIGSESDGTPGVNGGTVSGHLGHAAAFSFYPTKNLGALGDGGMVTTDDEELAKTVRALANYGSDRRYHNIYKGLNSRLDPLQAAILLAKLPGLETENEHRRRLATIYDRHITNPLVKKPSQPAYERESVWHQYVILCPHRDALREHLAKRGVETDIHYPEAPHQQPCYRDEIGGELRVTERIAREAVSLPITRCTTEEDAREIAEIIDELRVER